MILRKFYIRVWETIKDKFFWWKLKQYPIHTLQEEKFNSYKEGKPISAELALRVLQGDKDAIAELRRQK